MQIFTISTFLLLIVNTLLLFSHSSASIFTTSSSSFQNNNAYHGNNESIIHPTNDEFILIQQFHPTSGLPSTKVTLLTNPILRPSDKLQCRFDSNNVIGYYLNATALFCIAPTNHIHSAVSISASRNDGVDFGPNSYHTFLYSLPITITSIKPTIGSIHGGTILMLEGSGFNAIAQEHVDKLWCWYGTNQSSPVRSINTTTIQCSTSQVTAAATSEVVSLGLETTSYYTHHFSCNPTFHSSFWWIFIRWYIYINL